MVTYFHTKKFLEYEDNLGFHDYHFFDVIFGMCITAEMAHLGERQTEDLKVPGSNPENSLA